MLGTHWIADAEGCAPDRLTYERVANALLEIPKCLGLTVVSPPQVHHDPKTGIAGIVLLAESHFSIHCVPGEMALHVDLFSCREFSTTAAKRWLSDAFRAGAWSESYVPRREGSGARKVRKPEVEVREKT
jgi:S-adenosylmethionine/arginine decarboxylase-like enzyme